MSLQSGSTVFIWLNVSDLCEVVVAVSVEVDVDVETCWQWQWQSVACSDRPNWVVRVKCLTTYVCIDLLMHASNAATDRLDCPLVSTRRVVLSLIDAFAHYCLTAVSDCDLSSEFRQLVLWVTSGMLGLGLGLTLRSEISALALTVLALALAPRPWPYSVTRPRLIEHGFTSAPTQYRLYGRRFLQVWWPNQQCQSTEGERLVIQTGLSLTRLTSPWYSNTTCMQILYKKII